MKKNKLTFKESELVDLIEGIAKDVKSQQLEEQSLKKQIRKASRAQRKLDKKQFEDMSNQLMTTGLINREITDVDYKKYPKLNELSKETLMKQTIYAATALYLLHNFYVSGENCQERKDNYNLDKLDDFLNMPLNEVYGGMLSMSKEIPGGVLKRDVKKFVDNAEKLINMLYNHKLAQKHFKDAGLENPMDQWAKLNPYKENMSEYAADKVMNIVDVDCPKEGEESDKKEKKGGIASLFRKKKSFKV